MESPFVILRPLAHYLLLSMLGFLFSACSSLNLFGDDQPEQVPTRVVLSSQNQVSETLLQRGVRELEANQAADAEDTFDEILDLYPFSKSAAEAQYLLGESLRVQGKYGKAIEAYQEVLTRHPNSGRFTPALNSIYTLSESARQGEIKTSFLGISRNYDRGDIISWYESIVSSAPRSSLAPKSLLALGQLYAEDQQRARASQTLERLVREYPNAPQAPEAQLLLADVIGGAGIATNETRTLRREQEVIRDLQNIYGDDPEIAAQARTRLDQINTTQAASDLKIAQFYERRGNIRAATLYYREVLRYQNTAEYQVAQSRLTDLGIADGPLGDAADDQLRALAQQGRILTSQQPNFVGPQAPDLQPTTGASSDDGLMDFPDLPDMPGLSESGLFIPDLPETDNPDDSLDSDSGTETDSNLGGLQPGLGLDENGLSALPSEQEVEESTEEILRKARQKLQELQNQNSQNRSDSTSGASSASPATSNEEAGEVSPNSPSSETESAGTEDTESSEPSTPGGSTD